MLGIFLQTVIGGDSLAAPVADAAAETAKQVDTLNLWEMVQKGGLLMIPIGLLSLVTIFIFVERLLVLSRAGKNTDNLINNVRDQIKNENINGALMLCKSNATPDARILEKGISRIGLQVDEIEKAMEGVGKKELSRIEKMSESYRLLPVLHPCSDLSEPLPVSLKSSTKFPCRTISPLAPFQPVCTKKW